MPGHRDRMIDPLIDHRCEIDGEAVDVEGRHHAGEDVHCVVGSQQEHDGDLEQCDYDSERYAGGPERGCECCGAEDGDGGVAGKEKIV